MTLLTELVWHHLCELNEFLTVNLPNKIHWNIFIKNVNWTSQCTIDRLGTAEALVDSADLDVETRFLLAVDFCLQDHINALFTQIPRDYFTGDKNILTLHKISQMDGIPMAKEYFNIPEREPDYKECFREMVSIRNDLGAHYYWQRLNSQEKNSVVEPDFIESIDQQSILNYLLFILTNSDQEGKLKLLQNEHCRLLLHVQLLDLHWPFVFKTCSKDALKSFSRDSLEYLFTVSVERINSTHGYKQKYVQITMLIFLHLKDYSTTVNDDISDILLVLSDFLYKLTAQGEIKFIKIFLERVSGDWIKQIFALGCGNLDWLIMASLKSGMIEHVFNRAFPTNEARKKFLSEGKLDSCLRFLSHNQIDDIDTLLFSLLTDLHNVENYKIKFREKHGYNLCSEFLADGDWKSVNAFVQWCFKSEDESIDFYKKLCQSKDFKELFYLEDTPYSDSPLKLVNLVANAIFSLMKVISVKNQFACKDIVVDISLRIIYENIVYQRFMGEVKIIYEALDIFLLAFANDDQKMLFDLKKEIFADKGRKLYVSLPLDFLKVVEFLWERFPAERKRKDELSMWIEMISDFFSWVCSSNEEFRGDLVDEFWKSDEVLEVKKELEKLEIEGIKGR